MRAIVVFVLLTGCVRLTGNAEDDLDTLTDATEIDCNGAPPSCMWDALTHGEIGVVEYTVQDAPASPCYVDVYLFTYENDVVEITESHENGSFGDMWERRCGSMHYDTRWWPDDCSE